MLQFGKATVSAMSAIFSINYPSKENSFQKIDGYVLAAAMLVVAVTANVNLRSRKLWQICFKSNVFPEPATRYITKKVLFYSSINLILVFTQSGYEQQKMQTTFCQLQTISTAQLYALAT